MSTLQKNLVNVVAEKYLIQPDRLLDVLSKTAFKQKGHIHGGSFGYRSGV